MKKLSLLFFVLFFSNVNSQSSYTLESFIKEMLLKDFGIQLLKNEYEISKNNNNIGNAGYLPKIDFNAVDNNSSNDIRQVYFSGDSKEANAAKSSSLNLGLGLNWTIFDGFKMFATDKKLDLLENASELNLQAEIEMKIYQSSILFYTLQQQIKLHETYLKALNLSKDRYDLILLKRKNGSANEIQLIQSRLDLSYDSSVYLNSLKAIDNLKADINLFLSKEPNEQFNLEGAIEPNLNIIWDSVYNDAKIQNTSILLSKSNISIKEKERKEVQSYYYPQLSVFGQYNFASSKSQIGFALSSVSNGYSYGLTLSWKILDRLSRNTEVKNSNLQIENAEIKEKQLFLSMQNELVKAFNEYEWSKKNLELEHRNIEENKLNFKIAEEAYKAGSINNLELREIQFSITEAQSRYIIAQLNCKAAELNISLLTGNFKKLII